MFKYDSNESVHKQFDCKNNCKIIATFTLSHVISKKAGFSLFKEIF